MQAGPPQYIGSSPLVDIPRQHKKQVRKSVGVSEGGRVDRFLVGDFGHVPLGSPHDRARMMEVGRGMRPAWQNKAVQRGESRVECIDSLFDPGNLPYADPKRLHFAVLPFRTTKVAAEVEQVILDVGQNIANDGILDIKQGDADK